MITNHRLIPLPASVVVALREKVVDYWNVIATCDEVGGVPESLVRETEIKVTELLATRDPWDVYEANRLTAKFDHIRQRFLSS